MKREQITWVDSMVVAEGAWTNVSELRPLLKAREFSCTSVGWVVAANKEILLLAQSFQNDDHDKVMGALVIPARAILKRKGLK